MKKWFLVFLLLFLGGCQTTTSLTTNTTGLTTSTTLTTSSSITTETYPIPTNITYQNDQKMLHWTVSKPFSKVILTINDQTYETANLFFSLAFLPTGDYDITLQVVYPSGLSEKTSVFSVSLDTIHTFRGVQIEDGVVSFLPFDLDVQIELQANVDDNWINLETLDPNLWDLTDELQTSNRFRLLAKQQGEVIDQFDFLLLEPIYYDKQAVDDLRLFDIPFINQVLFNQVRLSIEHYTYHALERTLDIHSSFFSDFEVGTYTLQIVSNLHVFLPVHLKEAKEPIIITPTTLKYEQRDVSFQFNTFGGSLLQISGYSIQSSDYTFSNDTLIIHQAFIDQVKLENPSLTYLSISVVLYNDPYSKLIFLFITF